MNIIEAMEQLKAGKAIQRTGWGNAKIQAVQLESGQCQIVASGVRYGSERWHLSFRRL